MTSALCVCVCACVRACVRACACVCVQREEAPLREEAPAKGRAGKRVVVIGGGPVGAMCVGNA